MRTHPIASAVPAASPSAAASPAAQVFAALLASGTSASTPTGGLAATATAITPHAAAKAVARHPFVPAAGVALPFASAAGATEFTPTQPTPGGRDTGRTGDAASGLSAPTSPAAGAVAERRPAVPAAVGADAMASPSAKVEMAAEKTATGRPRSSTLQEAGADGANGPDHEATSDVASAVVALGAQPLFAVPSTGVEIADAARIGPAMTPAVQPQRSQPSPAATARAGPSVAPMGASGQPPSVASRPAETPPGRQVVAPPASATPAMEVAATRAGEGATPPSPALFQVPSVAVVGDAARAVGTVERGRLAAVGGSTSGAGAGMAGAVAGGAGEPAAGGQPPLEPGLAASGASRPMEAPLAAGRSDAPPAGRDAPVDDVPARIVQTAEAGGRQLQLRLQPAELGRLDIRLDFDGEHGLRVQIRADNDQALELLQRHGHQLERALQQSGFDVGRDGIRYDLDQGGGRFARGGQPGADGGNRDAGADGHQADDAPADPDHDAAADHEPSVEVVLRNVLDLHA